jgi:pyruvate dehydrogenase E1 component alpha subunit
MCAALTGDDYIFGTHRSHGHFLAKGGTISELVAEVYGREAGCARGRGGSMHLIDPEHGMMGSVPIVAGTISLAVGAALAAQIREDHRVVVSFFGDGATGEGALYEALNFAALRRLPIIFACENNLYSTHMPIREIRIDRPIVAVAEPFGIKGYQVDGNDVIGVRDEAERAVAACRSGEGPVFIEFLTYRTRGHVGPNDNIQGRQTDIRPESELDEWRARDPISRLARDLIAERVATERELSAMRDQIGEMMTAAHSEARRATEPSLAELDRYVFRQ